LSEDAQIVVFERGPYASFANCGLPYYVGGEIATREKLIVAGDSKLHGWLNLEVRTGTDVVSIDRETKSLQVKDLATGTITREPYDVLILSPGASPIRPAALLAEVGPDHPQVLSLRNIPDVDRIKAAVDRGIKSAIVIGGGFIGLEVAEQLVHRKLQVTLVEMLPQVMPPLDAEMVTPIHELLAARGISLQLGDGVAGLSPAGENIRVNLKSGAAVAAEMVILAIGVSPESMLAKQAGLDCNERGAIRVNQHQQTSDPAIYAVGDATETTDAVFGGRTQIPLAGPANRQGRLAADHALSSLGKTGWELASLAYRGSQGTSIVRVFDKTVAMTGASEKSLQRLGKKRRVDYGVVYVHPKNHADYYPGAEAMTLKLIFEKPTGRVLGAQAVGGAGVDKRIDVIAMALQMKATVFDLAQAELCYSPQYSSAKDPVNQAGFQATNVLQGLTEPITPADFATWQSEGKAVTLLDVRSLQEFAAGHVAGAVNIPLDQLRERHGELSRELPVITYCALGMRGYLSERILRQKGFSEVYNLSGGYRTWQQFHPQG
jgi:NADPH-dependent 2,4-dienoyl-CoA reductase/sulfur reductase-like enzyme/rhodanese-related sulfurtransferase